MDDQHNGVYIHKHDPVADDNITHVEHVTSGPIITQLNEQQFQILIPSFVLVILIMAVGVPGNIVTIVVYKTKMRRTASRIFILALTFVDLLNCLLTMPVEILIILNFWTFDYPIICSIGRTLTYVFNGISALLLCGIAVDRFRKICRPLKPVFTPKKIKSICVVSILLGFSVYIPGYLIYGTQTFEIPRRVRNEDIIIVGKTCLVSDTYKNTKIQLYVLTFWFLGTIAVMCILIIMYSLIGHAVFKRIKLDERRHHSVSSSSPLKTRRKRIVADHLSETSCSFEEIKGSDGKPPKVLKHVPEPARNTISQALKKRFSISKPNTVYSLKRERMSKRIRAGRTTLMLFSVTIAYIMSFLPFVIIVVIRTTNPQLYATLTHGEKSVWNFFLRSYVFNCAVNPILYGFFNKDFRNKMTQLFKDCC